MLFDPEMIFRPFQYGCNYSEFADSSSTPEVVTAEELNEGYVPAVCGFKSDTLVLCQALAVNSIGASPVANQSIFIEIEGSYFCICSFKAWSSFIGICA